jgi:hypothetical protein
MLTGREFSRHNPEVRNTNAGLPFSAHCVEVRWIVLSSGIYKNGNRTPLRNLRHTFLDYLLAGKINTSFQNSLHFIVERCRSLSPHMPTRTSALRRIGRVIILHDPFFSRAAASEGVHGRLDRSGYWCCFAVSFHADGDVGAPV